VPSALLDIAQLDAFLNKCAYVFNAEFCDEAEAVIIDCALADKHFFGYLLAGEVLRHVTEYFFFAV